MSEKTQAAPWYDFPIRWGVDYAPIWELAKLRWQQYQTLTIGLDAKADMVLRASGTVIVAVIGLSKATNFTLSFWWVLTLLAAGASCFLSIYAMKPRDFPLPLGLKELLVGEFAEDPVISKQGTSAMHARLSAMMQSVLVDLGKLTKEKSHWLHCAQTALGVSLVLAGIAAACDQFGCDGGFRSRL